MIINHEVDAMVFNLLELTHIYKRICKSKSCFAIIFLMMTVTTGYSSQTDNRGFPVQQQFQGSTFISPHSLKNTSVSNPSVNNTKTINHGHSYKNNHDWIYHTVSPSFYYYNPGTSPYFYYYYPGDDSYYNSVLPDNSPPVNTGYNQNNVQTALPVYDVSSLPDGTWITERDGNVPDKAFVFQIVNGTPTYYCRVQYNYTTYFGVLSPTIGCYIQDDSGIIKFSQYDVLISPN